MAFGDAAKESAFKRVSTLSRRDGQSNILPIRTPLYNEESSGKEIMMIPFTIGRINELIVKQEFQNINFEKVLCEECLVEPKLSWEEYQLLRPEYKFKIYVTLLFENGFSVEHFFDRKKKIVIPDEMKSDRKKMYEALKKDVDYARECFALHDLGYDMISIQRLTKREITILLEVMKENQSKGKKPTMGKKPKKGRRR